MIFTLKIPVTRYQFQLLEAMVGKSPFKIDQRKALGKMILSNFQGNIKQFHPSTYTGLYYQIEIPQLWVQEYGVKFPTTESVNHFMSHIEKEFRLRMFTYIDGVLDFKELYNEKNKDKKIVAKMKEAALNYLYKYNLNEEFMTFDTIKKAYQRHQLRSKTIDTLSL